MSRRQDWYSCEWAACPAQWALSNAVSLNSRKGLTLLHQEEVPPWHNKADKRVYEQRDLAVPQQTAAVIPSQTLAVGTIQSCQMIDHKPNGCSCYNIPPQNNAEMQLPSLRRETGSLYKTFLDSTCVFRSHYILSRKCSQFTKGSILPSYAPMLDATDKGQRKFSTLANRSWCSPEGGCMQEECQKWGVLPSLGWASHLLLICSARCPETASKWRQHQCPALHCQDRSHMAHTLSQFVFHLD